MTPGKFGIQITLAVFLALGIGAQEPVIPPELFWWFSEAVKARAELSPKDFILESTLRIPYEAEVKTDIGKFPVFRRWNYSADLYCCPDSLLSLTKTPEGRYNILKDVDSQLTVADPRGTIKFSDFFGSTEGIQGAAWLRDRKLTAVGIRMNNQAQVDLVIREYTLETSGVTKKTWVLPKAFAASQRSRFRLDWEDWREDYFKLVD